MQSTKRDVFSELEQLQAEPAYVILLAVEQFETLALPAPPELGQFAIGLETPPEGERVVDLVRIGGKLDVLAIKALHVLLRDSQYCVFKPTEDIPSRARRRE
jgi:hypothetical protein